ncbi:glycosyltransferase family 4 protein [Mucilaginibacter pallidiroseus]|uniref:Glycosyltransferase family 4 protein n=1 Tax=Mucilaginibacter pallidiroseus TaxID=2599295 RepID=A0A563UEV1_9SPHI|nr:glycosyltransferase family 1 protein [Mucilaginibacter pallidiroseus]TWR29905.1 glycosyltransferase family 4 protein [Mucilaginibacter pallidiroseus]
MQKLNNKLRVGLWVDFSTIEAEHGGGYSYYKKLVNAINTYKFDDTIEIVNIILQNSNHSPAVLNGNTIELVKPAYITKHNKNTGKGWGWVTHHLKYKSVFRGIYKTATKKIRKKIGISIEDQLKANGIDVVFYLNQNMNVVDYPFISVHWDIAHRSTHPFPETAYGGNYPIRDSYYKDTLSKAMLLLCESEAGIKELLYYCNFFPQKVKLLPIFAGDIIDCAFSEESDQQCLSDHKLVRHQFFLYPAQFWALKNHYNLIVAFDEFKKVNGPDAANYKLMLCGTDHGNFAYISSVVQSYGLQDTVIMPGFVSDRDLNCFYRNATAMVFPSFLGPTNMPLIEASHLGCPVICSDLTGHLEIMGSNALYFQPTEPRQIADHMQAVLDKAFSDKLANDAKANISSSKFRIGQTLEYLDEALIELRSVRKCWE